MTHSRDSQSSRRRWQQYVLSLSITVWLVAEATSALFAQGEEPAIPPLPLESNVSSTLWESWHKQSSESSWASYNIGRIYHLSDDPKSAKNAFLYYTQSAESGYAKAQANLGYCYDKGIGTRINLTEAKRWYKRSAEQGNLIGQINYAQKLLDEGIKTKTRSIIETAREWFKKAYEQDNKQTEAVVGIGLTHASIHGATTEDYGKAREWLSKANEHHEALFALGWLDEKQKHYGSAIEFYRKAKAHKSLAAAYNLARCRENGLGVAQNKQEAIKEYRYAATRGHAMSQFALGLLIYSEGNRPVDYMEAVKWWRLAEKSNSSETASGAARDALEQLRQSRLLTQAEFDLAEHEATMLDREIQSRRAENETTKVRFNREKLSGTKQKPDQAFSAFFITNDGWLLTSAKHIEVDPTSQKFATDHTLKVQTEDGLFSDISKIITNRELDFALLKVEGTFSSSLPLSEFALTSGDKMQMYAATRSPLDNGSYRFTHLTGQAEPIKDNSQRDYFLLNILNTKNSTNKTYSNFLSYNKRGQATGLALHETQESGDKLKVLKSSAIKRFIESKAIVDKNLNTPTEAEINEGKLNDLVRQATATVLIYID